MLTKRSGGKDLATALTMNSKTKSVIPGTSKWAVLRRTARAFTGAPKMDTMFASSGINPGRLMPTMVRKSGIAMATPRSIVDQVTGFECLEAGVDLEPPGPALGRRAPALLR